MVKQVVSQVFKYPVKNWFRRSSEEFGVVCHWLHAQYGCPSKEQTGYNNCICLCCSVWASYKPKFFSQKAKPRHICNAAPLSSLLSTSHKRPVDFLQAILRKRFSRDGPPHSQTCPNQPSAAMIDASSRVQIDKLLILKALCFCHTFCYQLGSCSLSVAKGCAAFIAWLMQLRQAKGVLECAHWQKQ